MLRIEAFLTLPEATAAEMGRVEGEGGTVSVGSSGGVCPVDLAWRKASTETEREEEEEDEDEDEEEEGGGGEGSDPAKAATKQKKQKKRQQLAVADTSAAVDDGPQQSSVGPPSLHGIQIDLKPGKPLSLSLSFPLSLSLSLSFPPCLLS